MIARHGIRETVCVGALVLCMTTGAAASRAAAAPERAVRDFITALAMHDIQAFARGVRPDPRANRFINPQPLTPDQRTEAARRLETLQIRQTDDVLLRGEPSSATRWATIRSGPSLTSSRRETAVPRL